MYHSLRHRPPPAATGDGKKLCTHFTHQSPQKVSTTSLTGKKHKKILHLINSTPDGDRVRKAKLPRLPFPGVLRKRSDRRSSHFSHATPANTHGRDARDAQSSREAHKQNGADLSVARLCSNTLPRGQQLRSVRLRKPTTDLPSPPRKTRKPRRMHVRPTTISTTRCLASRTNSPARARHKDWNESPSSLGIK